MSHIDLSRQEVIKDLLLVEDNLYDATKSLNVAMRILKKVNPELYLTLYPTLQSALALASDAELQVYKHNTNLNLTYEDE